VEKPQTTHSRKEITIMLFRVFLYTLGLEIWLHYFFQYAFTEGKIWKSQGFQSYDVCLTGFWTLNFMYLKFLIIWRFFRVAGLYDGIDSPENMNRCVNNNYTFTGFWRSWHGSLNKWILRYLYIPLGGNREPKVVWQMLTIWPIFIFIGLWHDLLMRWVAWALCNAVFFTLEICWLKIFSSDKVLNLIGFFLPC
jgi:D-alanyl-lipoteichoic acid acyltransferase DltB (MBOAT superfamily)